MGNIVWISRNGSTNNGATIVSQDRLEYGYNGNQVTVIRDWSNNVLGFNDKAKGNPGTYYTYDASGRLTKDNNLKNTYTYNHLNLVKQVEQTGVTNKLAYTYDATGRRLKKQFGTDVSKARYYTDGIGLAGDTTMIQTTFGRLRRIGNSSPWNYDYFLKDHLGNVRVVLTAGAVTTSVYMATMEEGASPNPSQGGETAAYESFYFANLDNTRADKPYNYPDNNPLNQKLAKVPGKSRGPSIMLKVMAGDTIEISAKAFYNMDNTLPGKGVDIAPVVGSAIAAMTNPTGTVLSEAAQLAADLGAEASQSIALVTLPEENNDEKLVQPKSGINFVLYNSEFEIVEANTGVQVVSDKINTIQTLATDKMVMTEAGFLEIFINNEAQTPVYYDNLMITQTNSQVKEINAYYPFGAMIPQLSVIAAREEYNGYKYNAKELQKELGMNQLDYGARMYEPAIGRWWTIDPKAEKYYSYSPYNYCLNNPVKFVDPDGKGAEVTITGEKATMTFNVHLYGRDGITSQDIGKWLGDKWQGNNGTYTYTVPVAKDVTYDGKPLEVIINVNIIEPEQAAQSLQENDQSHIYFGVVKDPYTGGYSDKNAGNVGMIFSGTFEEGPDRIKNVIAEESWHTAGAKYNPSNGDGYDGKYGSHNPDESRTVCSARPYPNKQNVVTQKDVNAVKTGNNTVIDDGKGLVGNKAGALMTITPAQAEELERKNRRSF